LSRFSFGSAATVGCFAFLRKRALVGDAIAHAILPGLALAFLLSQSKNPLYLLLGALASGWLAMYLIEFLAQRSKLSGDTSIALVLSVFFGFGILLLTHIQHSSSASQAGLDDFLFGQAAGMRKEDLQVYAGVALLLLLVIALLYKELMLFSFNPEFAAAAGLPTQRLKYVLNAITVLAIAIGIQSVGVVLMAALLITPAAAARAWTDRLGLMILLSAFLGAFSGLVGSYISYSAPTMPTGPWIVMSLSVLALLSLFLAPRRGLLARLRQQRRNRHKIADENLLKVFFQAGEKHDACK
jgi:ABC-type Mn2+/Zn2+ transport systems, permease components